MSTQNMNRLIAKFTVVASLMLLLALLYFWFIQPPKQQKVAEFGQVISQLEEEIQHTKEELKKTTQLPSQIMVPPIPEDLPSEIEIAPFLKEFSSLGRRHDIDVLFFKPLEEKKYPSYAERLVEIRLRGTFPQILNFFEKLLTTYPKLRISTITMTEPEEFSGL